LQLNKVPISGCFLSYAEDNTNDNLVHYFSATP